MKELGSTSNLHPPSSNVKPEDDSQEKYEMQEPWSGVGVPWGECRAEPMITTAFPLEDSKIHKSTGGSGPRVWQTVV